MSEVYRPVRWEADVLDLADVRLARRAPGGLRPWNELGVVIAADIHVAGRLATLGADTDDDVLLGVALAVRALRLGHVCVDLSTVARTVSTDVAPEADLGGLPWPDPVRWRTALANSPLVAVGDLGDLLRPLRLVGQRLYLDRYWRQECQVAADLLARSVRRPDIDAGILAGGLDRLWPPSPDHGPNLQRSAAGLAVTRGFAVVAGGPGTGKTTTVARILALLMEQAEAGGRPPPRVALAAPTGKAAARLEEAVHHESSRMPVSATTRDWLLGLSASTLHRLLGRRPDSETRFRHDHRQRLPHEAVIVDETSMVSLSLMAHLLEAVRPDARLVLVGDHEQLASVEAGAVLGDIAGPAADRTAGPIAGGSIADGIVVLRQVHRYGGGIAQLAAAIQVGDADRVVELARAGVDDLVLIETDADRGPVRADTGSDLMPVRGDTGSDLTPVRRVVVETFRAVTEAAGRGDGLDALRRLGAVRVLCAHRRGPAGVGAWTARIEAWLQSAIPGYGSGGIWYLGRPLLVTANDYELQLFNGDTGVVARGPDGQPAAAFERSGEASWTSPARLREVETVYAMTVHKSQGSQFDQVVVVLPDPTSPILTRQLLYTAVTRARQRVTLVGSEAALRAAVVRPIARASGLRDRLWGQAGDELRELG